MMNCLGDESRKKLAENIAGAITDRTKAVILNSPCNPTGMILERETLSEIAALAKKHDLWVLSDEVYRTIVFGGECASILEMPGMKQRTILIDSFSKRFSMTGFRVGFVCAQKEIAQAVANLQENVNSCACMFAQYACKAALENGEEAEKEICSVFKSRCEAMTREIRKSTRLAPAQAQATFYLFIDITKTGVGSEEFAYRLLEEKQIAVVPGNAFGVGGEGYIRIACTLSEEKLIEAAREIVRFADSL